MRIQRGTAKSAIPPEGSEAFRKESHCSIPGPTATPGSKYSNNAPSKFTGNSTGPSGSPVRKVTLSGFLETLEMTALNRPPSPCPSVKAMTTWRIFPSDFRLSKSKKASFVEVFIFLMSVESFGLKLATELAFQFRLSLPKPLRELVKNLSAPT